ncbi:hypothetical protein [Cylindrospermopsis raciborskii]|uniref:Cell division protein FtsL n=1 Tax=Cylindrospermopsis raciborskii CENA302 TaxID=1170768 RepID=A0A9Q5QUD4_9CYAN|nr:hypothetical protein [Cylindrospermopsis raciborskii]MCZ2202414.1 hypothetical protein [Cylindrospermopsis raciborskii PAMP2012]MCZ2206256.1 hypothetical protein [Cylindrospermopsis raciborskii PAMP2011]NLQ04752.1 hypothetical protein [Cylindrospermopsis raciborskii MVCC19]OHY33651.1 hypothetical protein BCV64_08855 [Cylindrospermopsis raciborskii MVCC14]OPH08477.1 hypothetical protein CENA302_15540 [Cylindrospermopsis raciborskii CENA302]
MSALPKSAVFTKSSWFRPDSSPISYGEDSPVSYTKPAPKKEEYNSKAIFSNAPVQKAILIDEISNQLPISSNSENSWIIRLNNIHHYSSMTAFLFVVVMLAIYGGTVYCQQIWSHSYRKLESLQRQERQLTAANATMISKMAREAEAMGLGLSAPGKMVFLPAVSNNSQPPSRAKIPQSSGKRTSIPPLGY